MSQPSLTPPEPEPTPGTTPPPPLGGESNPPIYAAPLPTTYPTFANGKPAVDEYGQPVSPKSRLAAVLLAWFLGVFGVHRFYVGKIGTGILMIVTLGGLGIWVLVDLIMILIGSFRDKEERRLYNW